MYPSATGTADLKENAQKFADEDEPDYVVMSVGKARKMGILPIGYRSNELFNRAPQRRVDRRSRDGCHGYW